MGLEFQGNFVGREKCVHASGERSNSSKCRSSRRYAPHLRPSLFSFHDNFREFHSKKSRFDERRRKEKERIIDRENDGERKRGKRTCCERNIEGWRLPGLLKKTGREERRRNSRDSPREARSDLLSFFPACEKLEFSPDGDHAWQGGKD